MQTKIDYKPHDKQKEFHSSTARITLFLAGVQSGKTTAGVIQIIKDALLIKGKYWIVAPTYPMSIITEDITKIFLPEKVRVVWNGTRRRITLINGSVIEFRSADRPDTLRGSTLNACLIDEGAMINDEAYRILRTRVAKNKGKVWITTTPKGSNWIRELYKQSLKDPTIKVVRCISTDNPYFSKDEADYLKENLPERFYKQELLAEFVENADTVFRGVSNCIDNSLLNSLYDGTVYVGIDLGKMHDYSVIIALDDKGRLVGFDRFRKVSWSLQVQRFKQFLMKYIYHRVAVDSTGLGDPILEEIQKERINAQGVSLAGTGVKNKIIDRLAIGIEKGQIKFPDIKELTEELKDFEYQITSSGNRKTGTQKGHDDCVIALGLAWLIYNEHKSSLSPQEIAEIRKFNENAPKLESVRFGEHLDSLTASLNDNYFTQRERERNKNWW